MQSRPESSDAHLVEAILAGSEAAFATLVERFQDRVVRLCGRYCRDQVECEDLAQEVFLKVFRKLHTFQGDSQFFTWLYRIAVNAATDHLARASTRRLKLVDDDVAFDARTARVDDPSAPMVAAETAVAVRAIVDALPEKFRTILVLREFEDLSYTEIAEVLQIQIGTVESRLFRARQRVKEAMLRLHPELLPGVGEAAPRGGSR